ncbi:MAG: hypothetical protein LAP38_12150 [Acidobacteriia bacterium]|nr:hypothetical protein [Terriglobia bacterium]
MAGFVAVLRALARSVWRDLRTFSSVSGNNLALFIVLVMYQQPQSIVFFGMVVGALLLGPLSGDPLRKVPADRWALWPLTLRQRVSLRLGSLALSPVVWVALPFLFVAGGVSFAALMIGGALAIQGALALWSHFTAGRARSIGLARTPKLPGRLGGLVQKNIRQMLSTLDFYAALLLALSGSLYRVFGSTPDPEAFMILALVVVIALSTYAQCLFGLDLPSGMARYRVLPLRGYEILLAKDIAFLLVAAVLVAPLAPLPGLAGALVAVAVGHHGSVLRPIAQTRWRFTGGVIFPTGFFQVFPLVAVGVATARASVWYLALAFVAYVASLWYYGRQWDNLV